MRRALSFSARIAHLEVPDGDPLYPRLCDAVDVSPASLLPLILCLVALGAPQPRPVPAPELARSRDPGVVTLLRHAQAPGTGDPNNFSLADCATQRNLSEQGRQQARRLGEALRAVGVKDAEVKTSQWCRCVETGRLLAVGPVQPTPLLNSFFAGRGDESTTTQALRAAVLAKVDSRKPTFFITHQVNITALTGIVPAEGEAIFVRATAAGTIEVLGRASLP
jgi:phosphohistidine phosphatase SixA